MQGKTPLSIHFEEQKVFDAISMAVGFGVPVYAYTSPVAYDEALGNEIIQYLAGARYRVSLSFQELEMLKQEDLNFYKVKPSALQIIAMHSIKEIGRVEVSSKGDTFNAHYMPFCNSLTYLDEAKGGLVLNELYRSEKLYVNLEDLPLIMQALGMSEKLNLKGISKSQLTEKALHQDSTLKYPDSQAGENLRNTHEGIIQYFIETIELDFLSGQLGKDSVLSTLLTKKGKFKPETFARELNQHSERLFGGEQGFKPDSLKKRIQAISSRFK